MPAWAVARGSCFAASCPGPLGNCAASADFISSSIVRDWLFALAASRFSESAAPAARSPGGHRHGRQAGHAAGFGDADLDHPCRGETSAAVTGVSSVAPGLSPSVTKNSPSLARLQVENGG